MFNIWKNKKNMGYTSLPNRNLRDSTSLYKKY